MTFQTIDNLSILNVQADAIGHCCNCHNVMGAGVAFYLREAHPEIYEADTTMHKAGLVALGLFSVAVINKPQPKKFRFCFNLYGQGGIGGKRAVNYEAIYESLERMRVSILAFNERNTKNPIKTIAFPYKMGSALAGGDWRIIETMIKVVFEKTDLKIIICKYEPK